MQEVVKKEIIKWLDVGVIYPIVDSKWVSPVKCVPKMRGITVILNEKGELVSMRSVTGWRACMDYRKLNSWTEQISFACPSWIKFLIGFQREVGIAFRMGIPVTTKSPLLRKTKRKPPSHVPMGLLPLKGCHSDYAMLRQHSNVACYLSLLTWWRIQWRYLWMTTQLWVIILRHV
ncbi:uncharacterized protein LOC125838474 [Solanum verrucosum]|uniref:uncharacterized protein LOC125838474 n=1 Tax=Solanum verrucosum TaxID=315347 RepID=UPI0020D04487|nr:uncharacterized protein LOC125838474 [Solanum verrucosum]